MERRTSPAAPDPRTADEVLRALEDNKYAQVVYHDQIAGEYDERHRLVYDQDTVEETRRRFLAVVGDDDQVGWPYRTALEIGAATGHYALNLMQAGVIDEVTITDLAPGMVAAARANAAALGFEVDTAVADAEALPFADGSFDIVIGRGVLRHVPDTEQCLREVVRVLTPGGRFVIADEPTATGEWLSYRWSQVGDKTGLRRWKVRLGLSRQVEPSWVARALADVIEVHAFTPAALARTALRAGAVDVRTSVDRLTLAPLEEVLRRAETRETWGPRTARLAGRGRRRLDRIDQALVRGVPQSCFFSVSMTGVAPS